MDIVFLFLILLLVVILLIVYVFNRIKYTTDIDELFKDIILQKPSTTSYSLGLNPIIPNTYDNVVVGKDGELNVTHDILPIDLKSKFISNQDHGTVIPNAAGHNFTVTGIDLTTFQCPEGYNGAECIMNPICDDSQNDVGKLKALTYSQFNSLGLYMNKFISKNVNRSIDNFVAEPTHPRIRVRCLPGNTYELQTCPNTTILNDNVNCVPYDICEDHINGYKHNSIIDEQQDLLMDNEYYICENNKSVLKTCANNTVFSEQYSGCITDSECFGMGDDTIYVDDITYLQCHSDRGEKINCPHGVMVDNGRWSCKISTCTPRIVKFVGELLEYNVGEVTCDANNQPVTKLCNRNVSTRKYNYEWGEKMSYSIKNWPEEIYDENRNCVPPTDDIIRDTTISLQWAPAMKDYHPFNVKTQTYDCSDKPDTKYRWDYLRKKIDPPFESDGRELINSAEPCQPGPMAVNPIKYSYTHYPQDTPAYIVLAEHLELRNFSRLSFWPQYIPSEKMYSVSHVTYTDEGLNIEEQSSKLPPYGFLLPDIIDSESTTPIDLKLIGYSTLEPLHRTQNYFISNGQPELTILYEPTNENTLFRFVDQITTTEERVFAINFTKITKELTILPELVLTNQNIRYKDLVIPITYILFYNQVNMENTKEASFIMGFGDRINIPYSTVEYPILKFTS